jgi:hypothetical protein
MKNPGPAKRSGKKIGSYSHVRLVDVGTHPDCWFTLVK